MNPVIRGYAAQIDDVNKHDRSIIAKINCINVDRYNTVIDPRGGNLDAYTSNAEGKPNKVVLYEHGKDPLRGSLPIGRNQWIRLDRSTNPKIIAKTQFWKDDFSQMLFEAYRDGDMSGWSVSILPESYGPPTKEEIRTNPNWEQCNTIYRGWSLLEYSATSVPGNPECLTIEEVRSVSKLMSRGISVPVDIKSLIETKLAAEIVAEMAAEMADEPGDVAGEPSETAQDAADARDASEAESADRNGPGCMEGKAKEESKPAPFAKSDEEDEEEKEAEDNEEEEKEEKKPKRDMMDGDPVDENCGGKKRSAPEPPSEPAPAPVAPAIIINPTPERAAPAPVLTLPPLEGRSYNIVLMDLIAQARAARVALTEEFQAYHDWLHGKV